MCGDACRGREEGEGGRDRRKVIEEQIPEADSSAGGCKRNGSCVHVLACLTLQPLLMTPMGLTGSSVSGRASASGSPKPAAQFPNSTLDNNTALSTYLCL